MNNPFELLADAFRKTVKVGEYYDLAVPGTTSIVISLKVTERSEDSLTLLDQYGRQMVYSFNELPG